MQITGRDMTEGGRRRASARAQRPRRVATVLVVEDDPTQRALACGILRGAGLSVLSAADGAAALRSIDRFAPDLILLDLGLPVLGGVDVLRTLRRHPKLASIPVVVLSADAGEETRREVGGLGASDYLVKGSLSASVLVLRLKQAMRRDGA